MTGPKTFEGKDLDINWDGRLCIHIGECGRAEGELFVGGRDPWCDPNISAAADDAAEICERCPTGALTYIRKDGGSTEKAAEKNTVNVAQSGPLYVRGQLKIANAPDDMPGVAYRAALCRCGASKNKPFCDNSHENSGFKDYGAVGQSGDASTPSGGELEIKAAPNGPLLVSGNLEIVAASGRVAWKGTRTALCRCGQSKNKPFCDGAHKAAGFEAP